MKRSNTATFIRIKTLRPSDLPAIKGVFEAAVHACTPPYTSIQIEAWAASIQNTTRWKNKLTEHHFIGAFDEKTMAGFASMSPDGYVDLLYVHPDYFRKRIGSLLYENLEAKARSQHLQTLRVFASIVARPFFEQCHFELLHEHEVKIGNILLINYHMEKTLTY